MAARVLTAAGCCAGAAAATLLTSTNANAESPRWSRHYSAAAETLLKSADWAPSLPAREPPTKPQHVYTREGVVPLPPLEVMSDEEINTVIGAQSTYKKVERGVFSSIHTTTFAANSKLEDRHAVRTHLQQMDGLLLGVFDGHSGHACSEWASRNLFDFIEYLAAEGEGTGIPWSDAFHAADNTFLTTAWNSESKKDGCSGACTVVAHVAGNRVAVANAGDCRAIIGRKEAGRWTAIPLSDDHDMRNNKTEAERLLSAHPNEPKLVQRYRVKRRLQPTRGLGDGVYKRMQYFLMSEKHNQSNPYWTPPYTTCEPDITEHVLTAADAFIILACDGVFEDLDNDQVVQCVGEYLDSGADGNTATHLLRRALLACGEYYFGRAAGDSDGTHTLTKVLRLPDMIEGIRRRSVHDDTTIIIGLLDHSGQYETDGPTNEEVKPPTPLVQLREYAS